MEFTGYTQKTIDRYLKEGWWGGRGLTALFERNAIEYRNKEALVDLSTRITWFEAELFIDRLALALWELGFKKDEIIACQIPNLVYAIILRPALQKCGILYLPLMMTLRQSEIEYILKKTEAAGIIIVPEYNNFNYLQMVKDIKKNLPKLKSIFVIADKEISGTISFLNILEQPLELKYGKDHLRKLEIGPCEVISLGSTTGTTGFPKIVKSPHVAMNLNYMTVAWGFTRRDIFGVFSPAFTGTAAPAWKSAPGVAAKIVLLDKFDAEEALKLINKEKITVVVCVPAQIIMMIHHPNFNRYDLNSVRLIIYAGASMPYHIVMEIEQRIPCKVVTFYGSSETGGLTITYPDDPLEVRGNTQGRVVRSAGYEVKLIDDAGNEVPPGEIGEVIARGPSVACGYYNDDDTTENVWGKDPDGWCHLGDLAQFDQQGNLKIVGRKKDMIIRGGQNIYPIEIENMLLTHPRVSNAVIIPMPDKVMGEKCCVYIIPKPGQVITFQDISSFLKSQKIAAYKIPERLEIVEKFPMTGGDKVSKRELIIDLTNKLKKEGKLPFN